MARTAFGALAVILTVTVVNACSDSRAFTTPKRPDAAKTAFHDNVPAASYTVEDLGAVVGSYTAAYGISPSGDVVGYFEGPPNCCPRALLWRDGTITDLGSLGGTSTLAQAVNARGQVVGWGYTSEGQTHGFIWDGGVMTDLGTLGSSPTTAYAINSSGAASDLAA
jgi:probable HAF family extracellular repeat protein